MSETDFPNLENETGFLNQPEVIANERLPGTELLVSIPTWSREWENGVLVRNMQAWLSQKLPPGEAIEINYVLNSGDDLPVEEIYDNNTRGYVNIPNNDPDYLAKRAKADEAAAFIKKVVVIQSQQDKIESFLDEESDPIKKSVLELAAKRSKDVAVSMVSTLQTYWTKLGYSFDKMTAYRTIGMDYANARTDGNGILLLFDSDAIPDDNLYARNVISLFRNNPETPYAMLRLNYQVPGANKQVVESAPGETFMMAKGYSAETSAQTTQIGFRLSEINRLKEIASLRFNHDYFGYTPGDEDRDTAARLIGLYADMATGLLFETNWDKDKLPVSLVEDRLDGSFDYGGAGGRSAVKNDGHQVQMDKVERLLTECKDQFQSTMDSVNDPALKNKLKSEYESAKDSFLSKQRRNLRFNRRVANDFIKIVDQSGLELVKSDGWLDDQNVVKQIMDLPHGKSLMTFLKRNHEILKQLQPDDLEVMKYCIDPYMDRPQVMDDPSVFQKALIDYLGYIPDKQRPRFSRENIPNELCSTFQASVADMEAYTHVYSLYQQRKEFYRDENAPEEALSFSKRTREGILNYQPIQADRDLAWLSAINPDVNMAEPGINLEKPGEVEETIFNINPRLKRIYEALRKRLKS